MRPGGGSVRDRAANVLVHWSVAGTTAHDRACRVLDSERSRHGSRSSQWCRLLSLLTPKSLRHAKISQERLRSMGRDPWFQNDAPVWTYALRLTPAAEPPHVNPHRLRPRCVPTGQNLRATQRFWRRSRAGRRASQALYRERQTRAGERTSVREYRAGRAASRVASDARGGARCGDALLAGADAGGPHAGADAGAPWRSSWRMSDAALAVVCFRARARVRGSSAV